jgi:hypothetical protein
MITATTLRRTFVLVLVLIFSGATAVMAQMPETGDADPIDPSSGEFDQFVQALTDIEEVQDGVNTEIDTILGGFSQGQEQFLELHQSVQASGGTPPDDIPDDVIEEYETTISEIDSIQMESQEEMIELVQDHGLSVARFNEMVVAVQQDPELQNAVQERRN